MLEWRKSATVIYNNSDIGLNNTIIYASKCFIIGSNNIVIGYNNTVIGYKNIVINVELLCNEINVFHDEYENVMFDTRNNKRILNVSDIKYDRMSTNRHLGVCCICMTNISNCIITPCFHKIICVTCALRLKCTNHEHCPKCRKHITDINLVYE